MRSMWKIVSCLKARIADGFVFGFDEGIMIARSKKLVPARAIHPGEVLHEELLERGIKQKDFAEQIGVHPTYLNEFIKGKRNLNEDLAIKLEKALCISHISWMNLHNGYVRDSKVIEETKSDEAHTC